MKPDSKTKYSAIIDGSNPIVINSDDNIFHVNEFEYTIDHKWLQEGRLHIIANNLNFIANIIEVDQSKKLFSIEINNKIYRIKLKDDFDSQLELMGLQKNTDSNIASIKAPMPGLVVKILVKESQEIKKGDNLLILKAMKMENIIKSPVNSKIKKILVKNTQIVEKDQELIIL